MESSLCVSVRTCHSLRDIEDGVDQYGIGAGWLWRGQANASWPLSTALERAVRDPSKRAEAEWFSFTSFRRSAHLYENLTQYGELIGDGLNDFVLSLMQHHGVPTRFLDFTESLYVAAYFALERMPPGASAAAVWAVDCNHLSSRFRQVYYPTHALTPLPPCDLGDSCNPLLVVPMRRSIGHARSLNQQGWGLVPLRVDHSFEENLTANFGKVGHHAVRFEIPLGFRADILDRLYSMNITRETLFPGLQGLGERIGVSMEAGFYKSR